jgi:predicted O-methyltransferase YrrM
VYNSFQSGLKFLNYFFTASNGKGHGTHSPFIFHFINKVLDDKTHYPEYDKVEDLRSELLRNKNVLNLRDLGAGSAKAVSNRRTIASIARLAAKPKKYGQLLFRIVKAYQPSIILELGTSLGITSSYLALGKPDSKFITMEGAESVASIARENLRKMQLQNATLIEGNFDDTLFSVLNDITTVDFVFIDGNHRREPTERYFQQLLAKAGNDSIFIFDDIHWSAEMEQAWQNIKNNPSVQCTIDLFFIGIVFFRKEFKEKQHFIIRY